MGRAMNNKNKKNLAFTHPKLAAEWHPTKNGALKSQDVVAGSGRRVWWKCSQGFDHEWEQRLVERTRGGTGCPYCDGKRLSITNSLETRFPYLVKEWHPTKNGELKPLNVFGGGNKKYWWLCLNGKDHEWQASIGKRKDGRGCPVCRGLKVVNSNCLQTTHPEVAKEWDLKKNAPLTPNDIIAGNGKKVWWICSIDSTHQWMTTCNARTQKWSGCPYCSKRLACESTCLATTHPNIVKEWHSTKNGNLTPHDVTPGSGKKVWWQCSCDSCHEWEAKPCSRTNGTGCPFCSNTKISQSNSLASIKPELIEEWDFEKNYPLTPYDVTAGSTKKVHWKCKKADDHEWIGQINYRVIRWEKGQGRCPCCGGDKVVRSNCLATLRPDIAEEWDLNLNSNTPFDVTLGSNKKVIWKCKENPEHSWQAAICDRVSNHGCPYCNCKGWTIEKIRLFVRSILPYISSFDPVELYVLLRQQEGLLDTNGRGKTFVQALKTGKFPFDEIEKFARNEHSLVDKFLVDQDCSLSNEQSVCLSEKDVSDDATELPVAQTKDILTALDSKITASVDKEAITFFIDSANAKIWRHAFLNESEAIRQLENYNDDGMYAQEVKKLFLASYNGAKNLEVSSGYNFSDKKGKILFPNLMQRHTAYSMQTHKRFGNWSGPGAGKTLAAIFASRVINARVILVCCPNSVVEGWKEKILAAYPDSTVLTKCLDVKRDSTLPQYLVLNYEFFQQPKAEKELKKLLDLVTVDFIVIDEIHYSKQSVAENISRRKEVIGALLSESAEANNNLHVLGMSATPVVNNLFEGKSLIELVTGMSHDELNTYPSVDNCVALYQKFVLHGVRWVPCYSQMLNVSTIDVDCSHLIDEIREIKSIRLGGSVVDLEAVLTKAKTPVILAHLKPKTIVYTYYVKDVLIPLQEEIENAGWKTAVYSGEDKTGLKDFLYGNADVLIATSCIGTGVDGLQDVCNRIIVATLPWTHAAFQQLEGRVYRQGQKSDHVDIIVPLTYALVNGGRWSWCESRWKRIQFKKSIADAAVDGIIPEGYLRSPAQAYKDAMLWLERLEHGHIYEVERRPITIPLSDDIKATARRYLGDLSRMNKQINSSSSEQTHERFKKCSDEWEYYHSVYRDDRKKWEVVPYQEAIKWVKPRPHMVIGDFGCGEAFLAKELENQVYSFDYVAINQSVIACDMAHVPLEDELLDAAIFSLSLMGTNYIEYLKEARRCLKLDGHLWIAEPTSRITDKALFKELLERLGFDVRRMHEKWKFTFIEALKSDREINQVVLESVKNILN